MTTMSEMTGIAWTQDILMNDEYMYMQLCISEQGHHLVQVMAWHRLGAKPLPESMLTYCWLAC